MKKITAENVEDDSVVASCNCRTKSSEIKFHKPGCKYRLITERDEARTEVQKLREALQSAREIITHTFYKFPEWQQAQDTLTQINAALQPKAGEKGKA